MMYHIYLVTLSHTQWEFSYSPVALLEILHNYSLHEALEFSRPLLHALQVIQKVKCGETF